MHRSRVDDLAPSTPAPSDAPKPCTCRTGRSIYGIQKRNPHRQKCQQVQTYVKLIHIKIQKKKETCNFNYSCQARHDKWKFSVLTMEVTATFERRKNILPGHVRWARSCSGRWRSSCRRPTISPRLGPPIQQAAIKNRMVKSRMSKSRKRSKVECPKSGTTKSRMSKSRTFKFRTNVWRESVAVNKNSNCVQRNWFLRSISDL